MPESKGPLKLERFFWFVLLVPAVFLAVENITTVGRLALVAIGFGVMIFVHELGHFIAAKVSGIKVEAFSIGMPPTLLGILRTEKGYRVRILPRTSRQGKSESALSFTLGPKAGCGETEYRIGLIPFGGFVKMLGQEDIGEVKTIDDPRSFSNKSVGARLGVVSAGVVLNALSAVVLFMIVFLIGIDFPPPVVGGVIDGYPAARVGLRPGDEIIEINGKSKYLDFGDLMSVAALSGWAEEIPMKARHQDGSVEQFYLASERKPGDDMSKFGIAVPLSLEIGPVSDVNALKAATGLQPGDHITSVNGTDVENSWQLEDIVQNAFTPTVSMLAERRSAPEEPVELVETQIRLAWLVDSGSGLANACSMVPRLKVMAVAQPQEGLIDRLLTKLTEEFSDKDKDRTTGRQELQLEPNDVIVSAADVNYPTYYELREITTAYEGNELPLRVLRSDNLGSDRIVEITARPVRQGQRVVIGFLPVLDVEHPIVAKTIKPENSPDELNLPPGATITTVNGAQVLSFLDVARQIRDSADGKVILEYVAPDGTEGSTSFEVKDKRKQISLPVVFDATIPFIELRRTYRADGPVEAVVMGFTKTFRFISITYATFRSLLEGRVGAENMMGPIGILQASYYIISQEPLIKYVYFIGILSSVIAVFNFLPLPPLDGGLALFLLIEKIKGSAVGPKIQTIVAGAGWILIGALVIYVTFNDIARMIFG